VRKRHWNETQNESGENGGIKKTSIICPTFFFDCLKLENGTDRMSRNVGIKLKRRLYNIPKERRILTFCCFLLFMLANKLR
jgi:hypothetical protein